MEFKTVPLDKAATIITITVTLFITALAVFFIIQVPYGWIFAILMALIPLLCYLLSPQTYSFKNSQLIIKKRIGRPITINYNEIQGYAIIPDFAKLKVSRTFGNGGLFGYYGIFSTAEYGEVKCQLTSTKNIIFIKTQSGTYGLSPHHLDRFEDHLKSILPADAESMKRIEPLPCETMHYASTIILLIPVTLYALMLLFTLLSYTQLPARIAVHFDAYGNPDGWGSKTSYLISSLIPSSILLIIAFAVFFIVRKTTRNKAIPVFLVIIVSYIMLYIAYTIIDTYWVQIYETHLIPMWYALAIFVAGIVFLLVYYKRKIVKKSTS